MLASSTIKVMSRLHVKSKFFFLAFVAAFLALGLPGLLPLCSGVGRSAMLSHPCCAGKSTCGTQFRRVPCCEFQSTSKAAQPYRDTASGSDGMTATSILTFAVNAPTILTKISTHARVDGRHAQAPPLYLSKQSFLC